MSEALDKAKRAKAASRLLAQASALERTQAIKSAAQSVLDHSEAILAANAQDMQKGRENGMPGPMLDRLLLTQERIQDICKGMLEVASQSDPIGEIVDRRTIAQGLELTEVRVPLGVVAMVYEARPNVTADAICLCLRSGNACVLRGGSAAQNSCIAIANACRSGIEAAGLPADCATLIESTDRAETNELMRANGLVDLLIPRGGHSLIHACITQATVPVIQTGEGNCHVFVEATADQDMALNIIKNAKTQRPGVCNAIETVLVDAPVAAEFLPRLVEALNAWGVDIHGDEACVNACCNLGLAEGTDYVRATEDDWAREYDSLDVAVKVVDGTAAAIEHINRYNTQHSEAIITSNDACATQFLNEVDAAAVYVNASTRFTDGGQFGLGAEIGISTQKLHVRGPMGASALTTTKCLLKGEGQVRA